MPHKQNRRQSITSHIDPIHAGPCATPTRMEPETRRALPIARQSFRCAAWCDGRRGASHTTSAAADIYDCDEEVKKSSFRFLLNPKDEILRKDELLPQNGHLRKEELSTRPTYRRLPSLFSALLEGKDTTE